MNLDFLKRSEFIERVLRTAGEVILEGYQAVPGQNSRSEKLQSHAKTSFKDLVTAYDERVEEVICVEIKKTFPGEYILGEESVAHSKKAVSEHLKDQKDPFWILDPIDGTTNYMRAYPFFCTTMAWVVPENGYLVPKVGAVYDPVGKEMFLAIKGQGAWLNRERLKCSQVVDPKESLLSTGFASERSQSGDRSFSLFKHLTKGTLGVRRDGSAALDLAYVAAGRTDAYWEWGLAPWDIAAGVLLVEEAGGLCTGLEGERINMISGEIIASNANLHKWVKDSIKEIQT